MDRCTCPATFRAKYEKNTKKQYDWMMYGLFHQIGCPLKCNTIDQTKVGNQQLEIQALKEELWDLKGRIP